MCEITNVFISQDRTAIAYELNDGDGGVFIHEADTETTEEVTILEGDWIALGGGRSLGHGTSKAVAR